MPCRFRRLRRMSTFRWIIIGFAGVILLGGLLLRLPIASRGGRAAPFSDALFTSVSAVCVTGLVVRDTASAWSGFGQAVILLLIQIGGLGVMTVAAFFTRLAGGRVTLKQRSTLQETFAAQSLGGIMGLVGFAVRVTLAAELLGALAMLPTFCRDFGLRGVWMAVFHAVSAFCNAGFDLMGTDAAPYVSLTGYAACPAVSCVVMALIVFGGLGFLTWEDLLRHRFNIKRYRMQTKVILTVTGILIVLPAVAFFFSEYADLPLGRRLQSAFFQSVTTRTAGFNTEDLRSLSGGGKGLMIPLMLIGGSPGSTAGGVKTTTLAVLAANAAAVFRRRESCRFFGRRVPSETVRTASALMMLYLALFFGGAAAISLAERLPMEHCLFETASAVGTVGLTLGITPTLGLFSRWILMLLMFAGRVGGLTLLYAALSEGRQTGARLPLESIAVG